MELAIDNHRSWRSLLAVIVLGVALGGGPTALAWFSTFGPTPVARLPLLALVLFGLLFVGAVTDLRSVATSRTGSATARDVLACGLAVGVVLAAAGVGRWEYLLAPASLAVALVLLAGASHRGGFAPRVSLVAAATTYVAATLMANFTLDSFIPLGDFFLLNVGTLFFGLTFTQRDRVHRHGRKAVYSMIVVAACANVALAAALGTPLRYVAVSFFTILVAETADTEVYQRLLKRPWLTRVAASNAVSAPLDTVIFTLLAFWGEEFATTAWLSQVIVTDLLVKYASGIVAALGMIALVRGVFPGRAVEDA
ncbi:MAG TPA: VUT family protein [Trueperaceae bacterium]|nr:VUT family protein [Trueperaceae bacterium]